jgi:hypothetical protein
MALTTTRLSEHLADMEEVRNAHKNLARKSEEKTIFGSHRGRWVNNNKMNLKRNKI